VTSLGRQRARERVFRQFLTVTTIVAAVCNLKQTLMTNAANGSFPPKVLNLQYQNLFLMLSRDLDTCPEQIVWL
jgi:hypothetical protein